MAAKLKVEPPPATPAQTTDHLLAQGDIKIRLVVLSIIGGILALLIVSIGVCFIWPPQFAPEYTRSVVPILSGAVFGFIGFIVGQKVGER